MVDLFIYLKVLYYSIFLTDGIFQTSCKNSFADVMIDTEDGNCSGQLSPKRPHVNSNLGVKILTKPWPEVTEIHSCFLVAITITAIC